eukprot:551955-Pelagomonas_calceolata.AAC.1
MALLGPEAGSYGVTQTVNKSRDSFFCLKWLGLEAGSYSMAEGHEACVDYLPAWFLTSHAPKTDGLVCASPRNTYKHHAWGGAAEDSQEFK